MEVRWQLFGILLCDQFEAANSVPRTKDSRKRKVAEVPEPVETICAEVQTESVQDSDSDSAEASPEALLDQYCAREAVAQELHIARGEAQAQRQRADDAHDPRRAAE